MRSIRRQVLAWVMGFLVLALLVMLYVSYQRALHEIEEIFDAELSQTARLIARLSLADIDSNGSGSRGKPVSGGGERHKYEKYINYQIWYKDALLLKSGDAPVEPLGNAMGFQDGVIDKRQWRVYGLYPEGSDFRVYTAEELSGREKLSWYFAYESLGIMFWTIPLFALIIALTVDRGLRPLKRLSAEVSHHDTYQLKPIFDDHMPKELVPLVNAINGLLARLDVAIAKERRFAADASHELRTPLSAIRLHSQLAMRADNLEDSRKALGKVIKAVDQSTHMVEQLLALARMSPEAGEVRFEEFNLSELCKILIDQFSKPLAEKNIRIETGYSISNLANVHSNPHLLHTILRNMLDNAIRYSDPDSLIQCDIVQADGVTTITVQDNGTGIPEDQLEIVQQRFTRLAGQHTQGCGLGLSIVSQAVECIGADLKLSNRTDGLSGLVARIRLPAQKSGIG